jgi:hypothetical protein
MLISTLSFSQSVIRVLNGQNIQTLIDAPTFVSGSILLLDPGFYGDVIINKRVSIIGSGYFNGVNETQLGDISFQSNNLGGSDGSLITGCSIKSINVKRNDITVQRCRIYRANYTISIDISNVNNAKLIQCFIDGSININGGATNFLIRNSLINGRIGTNNSSVQYTGKISYNILNLDRCDVISLGNINVNVSLTNNILITPQTCNNANGGQNFRTDYYAKFSNNIVRQGNYQSNDPSNKFLNVENMALVLFTTAGTSLEGQYILSANSPAKGAGEGGTDCGAFGGTEPYIIGGLPIGPVITDLQVPSTARQNETIQIKLKAKVQN